MAVRVDTVAPSKTAVVAGPMDLSRFMTCFDAVYAWLRDQSDVKQVGQNVALYSAGRMEVGVEVDRSFDPVGEVSPSELPGGRAAHATHTTGYGDLHRTYHEVERWCAENGESPVGVQWEVYADPDADDHVDVEIYFLLS